MKPVLNTAAGLDFVENDEALYTDLLTIWLSDTVFDKAAAERLIQNGNTEEAANYIHRFTGSSGQIGAERLYDAAHEAEFVLRGKASGDIPALLAQIQALIPETKQAIQDYLGGAPSRSAAQTRG